MVGIVTRSRLLDCARFRVFIKLVRSFSKLQFANAMIELQIRVNR